MQRQNKINSRTITGAYVPSRPMATHADFIEPPRPRVEVHEPETQKPVEPGLTDLQKKLMGLGLTFLVGSAAQLSERKQIAEDTVRRCKEQLAILKRDLDKVASRIYRATTEFKRLQKEYMESLDLADADGDDTEWIDMHYGLRFQDMKDIQERLQGEWERLKDEEAAASHALNLAMQEPALSEVNKIISDYKDGMKALGNHDIVKHVMENRRFEKTLEQTSRLTKRPPPPRKVANQRFDPSVHDLLQKCKQSRRKGSPPGPGDNDGATGGETGETDDSKLIHTSLDEEAEIL